MVSRISMVLVWFGEMTWISRGADKGFFSPVLRPRRVRLSSGIRPFLRNRVFMLKKWGLESSLKSRLLINSSYVHPGCSLMYCLAFSFDFFFSIFFNVVSFATGSEFPFRDLSKRPPRRNRE